MTFQGLKNSTIYFQGPPTRNIISQIVQQCMAFPVQSILTIGFKASIVCFTSSFQFTGLN